MTRLAKGGTTPAGFGPSVSESEPPVSAAPGSEPSRKDPQPDGSDHIRFPEGVPCFAEKAKRPPCRGAIPSRHRRLPGEGARSMQSLVQNAGRDKAKDAGRRVHAPLHRPRRCCAPPGSSEPSAGPFSRRRPPGYFVSPRTIDGAHLCPYHPVSPKRHAIHHSIICPSRGIRWIGMVVPT
jgi:hypothetical protein